MTEFEVTGFTKGTKRRRHQIIAAKTEAAAKVIASKRNIEVTSIEPVPPELATDAQLNYAFALGLSCPADATKEELSALIQMHLDNAEDPLDLLIELSRKHRIARVTYWKYGEPKATARLVEPYDLIGTAEEIRAVHCFQIQPIPTDGNHWRTFNLVNIKSVMDADKSFQPRRNGTLLTGELVTYDSASRPVVTRSPSAQPTRRKSPKPKITFGKVLTVAILIVVALWIIALLLKRE
jgi:hypothetical protein